MRRWVIRTHIPFMDEAALKVGWNAGREERREGVVRQKAKTRHIGTTMGHGKEWIFPSGGGGGSGRVESGGRCWPSECQQMTISLCLLSSRKRPWTRTRKQYAIASCSSSATLLHAVNGLDLTDTCRDPLVAVATPAAHFFIKFARWDIYLAESG